MKYIHKIICLKEKSDNLIKRADTFISKNNVVLKLDKSPEYKIGFYMIMSMIQLITEDTNKQISEIAHSKFAPVEFESCFLYVSLSTIPNFIGIALDKNPIGINLEEKPQSTQNQDLEIESSRKSLLKKLNLDDKYKDQITLSKIENEKDEKSIYLSYNSNTYESKIYTTEKVMYSTT